MAILQRAQVALEARRAKAVEWELVAARSKGAVSGRAKPMCRKAAARSDSLATPRTAQARADEKDERTSGARDRVAAGRAEPKPDEQALDETEQVERKLKLVEPRRDEAQARDWAKEPKQ